MKKIIFDTDLGVDCDDVGALALIHSLCDSGEAELLAVTHCFSTPYVAGAIDSVNKYCNRSVPIGINHSIFYDTPNTYAKDLCEKFENDYKLKDYKSVKNSVALIREILSSQEDKSVSLVVTGRLSTCAELLKSEPDEISSLTGKELISKKVERAVLMGGRFFESWPMPIYADNGANASEVTWEWNIHEAIEDAKIVAQKWPSETELVFSSYEIGNDIITLVGYSETAPKNSPIRLAYDIHSGNKGRCSWDLTAVLEAIRPGVYWNYQEHGKISVDDNGVTSWKKDNSFKHTYLLPKTANKELEDIMNNLIYNRRT